MVTSATWAAVRPTAGSVRTSSAGPGRRRAHASQAALSSSSIQTTGRAGPAKRSIAPSFQCPGVLVPCSRDRSSSTWGCRPTPSRWGRCSSAFSSQPEHQATSNERSSTRRFSAAACERRWMTPSTFAHVPGGGAVGSQPKTLRTPSMSTSSRGSCRMGGESVPKCNLEASSGFLWVASNVAPAIKKVACPADDPGVPTVVLDPARRPGPLSS